MNDAITMQTAVNLPSGATDQHRRHFAIDTDECVIEQICLGVGKRAAYRVLVLPPITFGLNMNGIEFSGTIRIEPDEFMNYRLNVTKMFVMHLIALSDRAVQQVAPAPALRTGRSYGGAIKGPRLQRLENIYIVGNSVWHH